MFDGYNRTVKNGDLVTSYASGVATILVNKGPSAQPMARNATDVEKIITFQRCAAIHQKACHNLIVADVEHEGARRRTFLDNYRVQKNRTQKKVPDE